MAYDIQLLAQASIYLLLFILNFIVAIPIGVNVIELDDRCMLYTDINWVNSSYFTSQMSNGSTCHFPVYVAVVAIFYTLIMGIYYLYVAFRSKDAYIGYQMWVLPFIVLSIIISILMFVVSCILSVGLKETCDGFMKGRDKGAPIQECSDLQSFYWINPDGSKNSDKLRHSYNYPKTSEVASWVAFLTWIVQTCLFILRFIRNRRGPCKRLVPNTTPTSSDDMPGFASKQPSA